MKKSIFETFIKKYNLNKTIESVKIVVDDKEKQLKTLAISDTKNLMVDITLNEFSDMDNSIIGVYNTEKLLQMLKVLGEDISITKNLKNDTIASLLFSDGSMEVQYATADLHVIPPCKGLKTAPQISVEIDMNKDFITKFIKSIGALYDSRQAFTPFTVQMGKKKKLEIVIGLGKTNGNRIVLEAPAVAGKDTIDQPLVFNADYIKDILLCNDECDSAVLKIDAVGIACISFSKNNFVSNYYLVHIKNVD